CVRRRTLADVTLASSSRISEATSAMRVFALLADIPVVERGSSGAPSPSYSVSRELAVDGPENTIRIRVFQLCRQQVVRKVLVADRPCESQDGRRADRREANVRRRGIGASMMHCGTYLHAGRKAVDDDAPRAAFCGLDQCACGREIRVVRVQRCGQLTGERAKAAEHLCSVFAAHHERERTEDLVRE